MEEGAQEVAGAVAESMNATKQIPCRKQSPRLVAVLADNGVEAGSRWKIKCR